MIGGYGEPEVNVLITVVGAMTYVRMNADRSVLVRLVINARVGLVVVGLMDNLPLQTGKAAEIEKMSSYKVKGRDSSKAEMSHHVRHVSGSADQVETEQQRCHDRGLNPGEIGQQQEDKTVVDQI